MKQSSSGHRGVTLEAIEALSRWMGPAAKSGLIDDATGSRLRDAIGMSERWRKLPTFDHHLDGPFRVEGLFPSRCSPNELYLENSFLGDPAKRRDLSCEEFLHRSDPLEVRVRLIPAEGVRELRGGALKVRMMARNIREPIEKLFPVRFVLETVPLDRALRRAGLI